MPSEEPALTMEENSGLDEAAVQGGPCPGRLGAPYAEAWGYFHLAPARPGHPSGRWATCRLCGEQVGRGPGFQAGTSALWRHLKSAHRRELGNSGAPGPVAAAEREWARLREQMGALAEQGRRRERELARREAAVARGERALERGRSALRALERRLQAEREALQTRLRELGWPSAPPPASVPKEDPEDRVGDSCVAAKVLL
ncbi:zinc finger BED domain-containing protein 3 [Heterocephalus glaber]|uniref:Zinc finger BED domain-containing protein 3 n=1 Tax=Heterocephalus glaber TaxID=10181 RepID=A0AAX6S8D5_HETGA|nr:zinc finger BED domain-containing protein 3 [Heterocephalus glaber]XP_021104227.1 zinc finger BED domain-containing protein 3 [Heterocephalus glaber]